MGITRKSKFGFPPGPQPGSMATSRLVPLTSGVDAQSAWPLMGTSSLSISNYLPIGQNGFLIPRSRLSSLNTIKAPGGTPSALAVRDAANFAGAEVWYSCGTVHGLLHSNGSISQASFVSAFGLGAGSLAAAFGWQYALAYDANIDENMLLAVGSFSAETVIALYRKDGASNGVPLYSYLTGAPRATAIGVFDNYVLAGALQEGGFGLATRIRWTQRGNSSNWTGEGSGFEDLLEMKGQIKAIKGTPDGVFYIFGDQQIWYGVGAAYPAQFEFHLREPNVGCPFPRTIAYADQGIVFLGSDYALRLIPSGGGPSVVIAPTLQGVIRQHIAAIDNTSRTYGVYHPSTRLYHLFVCRADSTRIPIVVNLDTGVWVYADYATVPVAGVAIPLNNSFNADTEGLIFINSTGTLSSTDSRLNNDNGAAVSSAWRSAPLAPEIGNYKQITQVDIDYRSTSAATLSLQFSGDGGNSVGNQIVTVPLPRAPVSGRATAQTYTGGAFPTIHIASTSTGYELHRLDVTMSIGGRRG